MIDLLCTLAVIAGTCLIGGLAILVKRAIWGDV